MKKEDMIEFLIEDGEFTEKKLKKMKVNDVQKLFDERFDVEFEDEDFSKGLEFAEEEIEEEVIEIEIEKLSTVQQRAYRRTGRIPTITVNKYTRFDDETPKMNN